MLDHRGLLHNDNVQFLTQHLDESEAAVARRTLQLAAKCRNAYAHGAVTELTDNVHTLYGHVVLKAVQLLVEVEQELACDAGKSG